MVKKTATLPAPKRLSEPSRSSDFHQLMATLTAETQPNAALFRELPIEWLYQGRFQPRATGDDSELERLAESIGQVGILEPLIVRPLPEQNNAYEILAGHRRWQAAQKAGLTIVPVIMRDVDDRTAAAIALIENLQRTDLNPIEEATALGRLLEEFQLTQGQLGQLIGKTESAISHTLSLLQLLPEVQALIHRGALQAGHGHDLVTLAPKAQLLLARQAAEQGWSVRELRSAKAALAITRPSRLPATGADPNIKALETRLSKWLNTPVRICPKSKGGGKIEIIYTDLEVCQSILQRMGLQDDE